MKPVLFKRGMFRLQGKVRRGDWPPARVALMISDPDIYRAARLLIDQHGESAAERAERRVSELWDAGDAEGAAVWRRILEADWRIAAGTTEGRDASLPGRGP